VSAANSQPCVLCATAGGEVLWQDDVARVVLVDEPDYPGFLRVIAQRHAAEWSDLSDAERARVSLCLLELERAQRRVMQPVKINLASLGNVVPHLHWHVIPRFVDDATFPQPIWAPRARETAPTVLQRRQALAQDLAATIRAWPTA
jgi:diadenosine tetraphosphate (Ap4A) HIT family hydrolase